MVRSLLRKGLETTVLFAGGWALTGWLDDQGFATASKAVVWILCLLIAGWLWLTDDARADSRRRLYGWRREKPVLFFVVVSMAGAIVFPLLAFLVTLRPPAKAPVAEVQHGDSLPVAVGPSPNVGPIVLETIPKQPVVGQPLGVEVTIRNTGESPALRVRGWSIVEPVAAFGQPNFKYLSDPLLNIAVMQPSSEHFTKHWLSRSTSTGEVVPINAHALGAITNGDVRIAVHGRLTYEDNSGRTYWVEWCQFLQKDFSGWVECASHNGAGNDGPSIAAAPQAGLRVQGIKFSTPTVGERLTVDVIFQNQASTNIVANGRASVFVIGLSENEELPLRTATEEAFEQHGWNELDKYRGPIRDAQMEPGAIVADRQGADPNGPGLTEIEVSELKKGRARAYIVGRQRWHINGKEYGCDYCAWLGPDGGARLCRRGNRTF